MPPIPSPHHLRRMPLSGLPTPAAVALAILILLPPIVRILGAMQ